MDGRGLGRGRERPPACKLAFSSSPSAGGREILIGSLNVNVNQNRRLARPCGGKMCLYLDSIIVLRNANGKINPKEEQKLVVKEMLFGISGLPEMFLHFFRLAI